MKTALYARVSSDSQDVDLSISAQLRALRDYAGKHDFQVIREFIDEAESGRNDRRSAFREMITVAKAKHPPFESILVWKLNVLPATGLIPLFIRNFSATEGSNSSRLTNRWKILPPGICWKE